MKDENPTITILNDSRVPITFPKEIGKFRFLRLIGKGSFSIVSIMKDIFSQELYAAKIVSRSQLIRENFFPHFDQEIRLGLGFNHPNIIKIFDILYEKETIFAIMEYCRGGDLLQFINSNGPLHPFQIKYIFQDLLKSIQYIHNKNVSHGDIKPENILLDDHNSPKLADFGFCHLHTSSKLLNSRIGSSLYASPELLSNEPYDGIRSDMWSLGVVLYAMAKGTLPWKDYQSQIVCFDKIKKMDYSFLDDIDPPIKNIIRQLLNFDPKLRPLASEFLNDPWLKNDSMNLLNYRLFAQTPVKNSSSNINLKLCLDCENKKLGNLTQRNV